MQTVSTAWKENQKDYFVSEAFVEINLTIGDPDAQSDTATSDNGHTAFSNVGNIAADIDKDPARYATGEINQWLLDGSFEIVPDAAPYGENGYIGNVLSGPDKVFSTVPVITVSFSKVFESIAPGVTITWGEAYDEFADTFRVTAYNGSTVVAQETITGNRDTTSVVSVDLSGYDKITIEVLKWCLPYRRARIKSLLLGISRTYAKSEIMSFSHDMTVDPLTATLPKSEITFEVSNLDGEYNPDNPEGIAKYLMERQSITAKYGYRLNGNTEWIKGGTFYMSEWETPQNGITATFTARDALEYMSAPYTGTKSGSLMSIATAAFTQAGLPTLSDGSVRWSIDSSLSSIDAPISVDMDPSTTIQEVLQYCANAACCVFYQDRDGLLHIAPLADGGTDYRIDQFNSYQNSESSLTKQLKAVDINNGAYTLTVGTVGETQTVINPLISISRAPTVAAWIAAYLQNRKLLSGDYRADPRLDPLDRVTNENQFSESTVLVTSIKYTFNGAFRGHYEGRQGV